MTVFDDNATVVTIHLLSGKVVDDTISGIGGSGGSFYAICSDGQGLCKRGSSSSG